MNTNYHMMTDAEAELFNHRGPWSFMAGESAIYAVEGEPMEWIDSYAGVFSLHFDRITGWILNEDTDELEPNDVPQPSHINGANA